MNAAKSSTASHGAGPVTVLLTILPEWADAILSGQKSWEYRRAAPRVNTGARIVLYASGSMRAIVGECRLAEVRRGPVGQLAEATAAATPHSPAEIRAYFVGKSIGTALRVDRPRRYTSAVSLDRLRRADPSFVVPQNFVYLRSETNTGAAVLELLPPPVPSPLENQQTSLF